MGSEEVSALTASSRVPWIVKTRSSPVISKIFVMLRSLQTQLNTAYTKVTSAYQKVAAVYKHAAQIAKGTSEEPNALLQWASASQNANDVTGAITAYRQFLKVAPTNPNAATVRQTLAQLIASTGQSQR